MAHAWQCECRLQWECGQCGQGRRGGVDMLTYLGRDCGQRVPVCCRRIELIVVIGQAIVLGLGRGSDKVLLLVVCTCMW